jgi:hypothetical protein
MNSYSQSGQDVFVCKTLKEKHNGYFLEIGSNHPIHSNNSYLLETKYNWKGIMVEYDQSFAPEYKLHRPRSIHVLDDARNVPYRQLLDDNHFPTNMDYLQVDLDVNNKSTLDTLEKLDSTVFDTYKFATITFEHDIYTGDYFDTRNISRQLFKNRGYVLVFPDVKVYGDKPFEDWYVHPDLVDMEYIQRIKTDVSQRFEDIMPLLL